MGNDFTDIIFPTYKEAAAFLDNYFQKSFHPVRKDSRVPVSHFNQKVKTEAARLPAEIEVQYFRYVCKHFGKGRKRSKGIRPNQKILPSGCEFHVAVKYMQSLNGFKVTSQHLEHSGHPTGEKFYQEYSTSRRTKALKTSTETMLNLGANPTLVADFAQNEESCFKSNINSHLGAILSSSGNVGGLELRDVIVESKERNPIDIQTEEVEEIIVEPQTETRINEIEMPGSLDMVDESFQMPEFSRPTTLHTVRRPTTACSSTPASPSPRYTVSSLNRMSHWKKRSTLRKKRYVPDNAGVILVANALKCIKSLDNRLSSNVAEPDNPNKQFLLSLLPQIESTPLELLPLLKMQLMYLTSKFSRGIVPTEYLNMDL